MTLTKRGRLADKTTEKNWQQFALFKRKVDLPNLLQKNRTFITNELNTLKVHHIEPYTRSKVESSIEVVNFLNGTNFVSQGVSRYIAILQHI